MALLLNFTGQHNTRDQLYLYGYTRDKNLQIYVHMLHTSVDSLAADTDDDSTPTYKFRVIRGCHVKRVRVRIRFIHLLEIRFLLILQY